MAKKKSNLSGLVATGPSEASKAQERKWQVESALSTMERAKEIEKDKSLMKEVKAMAKEKMNDLKKLC